MTQIFKTIEILIFLAASQISFGQVTKTYNGNFNTTNFRGTSSYQYYEDKTQQRIFQGSFNFKTTNNSAIISGFYLNDQKNGNWKFSLSNIAYTDLIMKYIITSTVTGTYIKGNLDGTWTLNRIKVISFSNSGISGYYQSKLNDLSYLFDGRQADFNKSTTAKEYSIANFKDNHFTGIFTYNINGGKSKIIGQFDENGYFDGNWTVTFYSEGILHQLTKKYQNGVLVSINEKDNSTGVITTKYDASIKVANFFKNYSPKENQSFSGKEYLKLSEGKSTDDDDKFLDGAISIWFNNKSTVNSSYAFEYEKGSNKMTIYPERKIETDKDKTEQYQSEQEQKKAQEDKKLQEQLTEKKRIQLAKEKQDQKLKFEEEQKRVAIENSDYGQIRKKIISKFSIWLKKKEFETDKEYSARIKSNPQAELQKIAETEIEFSKNQFSDNVLSGALQEYNIANETFLVKIFKEYGSEFKTDSICISVPKNIAGYLKSKFESSNGVHGDASFGSPILVHILEVVLSNNHWVPARVIFIFPNQSRTSRNDDIDYYDEYSWNKTRVENKGVGQYILTNSNHVSLKPFKLKDIKTQYNQDSLDKGVFFYEWNRKESESMNLNFTIENLGLTFPQ